MGARVPDADLLVVGGGPVGLVTALHAVRLGLRPVVVEPRPGPVDKACGEGIMPAGVRELDRLGVRPDGLPLRGITYLDPVGRTVRADLAPAGLGVRRTTLHAALADAARAQGVELVRGRVVSLAPGTSQVVAGLAGGGTVTGRHVVAADGLHSPTRRVLGLDRPRPGPRRQGLRRHYRLAPWTQDVEVHWGPTCEGYVTPVAPDLVGVAVLAAGPGRWEERLAELGTLAERLAQAQPVDRLRGAGPLRQRAAAVVQGRVLLVGDAGGYVDALTGEGLSLGWQQARAAVEAVAAGDPARYAREHARIGRAARGLTAGLVGATRHPPVRRHLVQVATHAPWAFQGAVSLIARG